MLLMEFMLTLSDHRKELAPEMKEDDRRGYTDDVMKRMLMVTDYIKNNPKEAAALLAPKYNVTEEEILKIFGNFNFGVELSDDDVKEITTVADYAYKACIIKQPVSGDEFINRSYLN
jgi:ABC-type nitrate/sulfonate/bicarbonate transport system substrate-binding protein